jgi:hypothetical protein
MRHFYTYCYFDTNNKPYYIGKGKGRRAYRVHGNVSVPPKDRILILKDNLTEQEAFMHEMYMIFLFGKKTEGGLLENKTDGGEINNNLPSWTGKKHSDESKKKISKSVSGVNHPQYGKPLTEEHKNKIKETKKKNPQKFSSETRLKLSLAKKQYWARKRLERHGES